MKACAGCSREAEYEVYTGSYWQPHCESCANEAMDCKEGALIRRLDELESSSKDQSKG
ncbi:hypothetical protein J41TS4_22790 [Paenibacillus apis]|uniref:Uncharacterized protein n=1 Tax=Paenibacillus apis TaxID=1792174 RepID=A0A920CJ97_9BACL|nr:hypothetical protein J41TS4_22790 [Paenibacillus apis]